MKTVQILALLSLLLESCVQGSEILSPPLASIDGKRVRVELPKGFRVIRKDDDWNSVGFDFDMDCPRVHNGGVIGGDIYQYAVSRAKREGLFVGKKCRLAGGYAAYYLEREYEMNSKDGGVLQCTVCVLVNRAAAIILQTTIPKVMIEDCAESMKRMSLNIEIQR